MRTHVAARSGTTASRTQERPARASEHPPARPRPAPARLRDQRGGRASSASIRGRSGSTRTRAWSARPGRPTNIRLYSEEDIRRILWIRHLTRDRGVNLAGIRILFELEERLGKRILEAPLRRRACANREGRRGRAPRSDRQTRRPPERPTDASNHFTAASPPAIIDPQHRQEKPDGQASVHPGRSPTERDVDRIARAAARRPPRDGHLPGDDRPAPGRPREERRRAQRRGRRRRPDRARHPAPGRAGGHRRARPSSTTVGTLAKIAQVVQLQDGTVRAIVQGQSRLRLHGFAGRPSRTSAAVVEELADDTPGRASRSRR